MTYLVLGPTPYSFHCPSATTHLGTNLPVHKPGGSYIQLYTIHSFPSGYTEFLCHGQSLGILCNVV